MADSADKKTDDKTRHEDKPGLLKKFFGAQITVWQLLATMVAIAGLRVVYVGDTSRDNLQTMERRVSALTNPINRAAKARNVNATQIIDSLVEAGASDTLAELRKLDPASVAQLIAEYTDSDEDGLPDAKDACPMVAPILSSDWNQDGCDDNTRDVASILQQVVTGTLGYREIENRQVRYAYQAQGYTIFCVPLDGNGFPFQPTAANEPPPKVGLCLVRSPYYH